MAHAYIAGEDMTSLKFRFATINASSEVVTVGAAGEAIGIVEGGVKQGEPTTLYLPGERTKITGGGTVSAGTLLASDASARGVAATTGQTAAAMLTQDVTVDREASCLVVVKQKD